MRDMVKNEGLVCSGNL